MDTGKDKMLEKYDKLVFGDPEKLLKGAPFTTWQWFNVICKISCLGLAIYYFIVKNTTGFLLFYGAVVFDYFIMMVAVTRIKYYLKYQKVRKLCKKPKGRFG